MGARANQGSVSGMADYEYKVVPAPRRPKSYKGVRSQEDQFATMLAELMNEMARDDWEYLRAESLPCEEKTGLTSRVVSYRNVLIFRRRIAAKDKFFETPNPLRIAHQPDAAETGVVRAIAPDAPGVAAAQARALREMPPDQGAASPPAKSSILSILKARRARTEADAPEAGPASGEGGRLAAE